VGVNQVSCSNQDKKTTKIQTNQHSMKGQYKISKKWQMRILVSDCLSKNCQAQAGCSKKQQEKVTNAKLSRVVAQKVCKFLNSSNAMSSHGVAL